MSSNDEFITVKIPRELAHEIRRIFEDTLGQEVHGLEPLVIMLLRRAISSHAADTVHPEDESESVKERLRKLGYL